MYEYQIIIDVLSAVFNGENLGKSFNDNVANLDKKINISKIKDISYGVLRNYYVIESILNKLVTKKPKDEIIKIILLIAIYEIKYTKKPDHAVTNDMVEFSFSLLQNQQIKGFINAVVRNYIRRKEEIDISVSNSQVAKYNFPKWWITKLTKDYPKQYQQILSNLNIIPKINLRVNPKKISLEKYMLLLQNENIEFTLIENKISLTQTIAINKLPLFNEGAVSVQDIHAQKLIELIEVNKNDYILDACSAPGGKLCQILENYDVEVLALDIEQNRLDKVRENLERLNLKARLIHGDATTHDWWNKRLFDVIIADVPCSASGTVKRNPDIKIHRNPSDIGNFVLTQRYIITNLWQMLKIGGTMVYITCSIFKEENEDNISYFKEIMPGIKIIKSFSLLPTEYADGFFYCILQKITI